MTQRVYNALRRKLAPQEEASKPKEALQSESTERNQNHILGLHQERTKGRHMTATASLLDEGLDRVQTAWKSMEKEVQKVQKQFEDRSADLNKRAEKQIKQIQKDFEAYPGIKRARSLGDDIKKEIDGRMNWVSEQVETSVTNLLAGMQIASRSEINKLDRKLNRINRRLKAIDKAMNEKAETIEKPEVAEKTE